MDCSLSQQDQTSERNRPRPENNVLLAGEGRRVGVGFTAGVQVGEGDSGDPWKCSRRSISLLICELFILSFVIYLIILGKGLTGLSDCNITFYNINNTILIIIHLLD